jgi:hypothetical protein
MREGAAVSRGELQWAAVCPNAPCQVKMHDHSELDNQRAVCFVTSMTAYPFHHDIDRARGLSGGSCGNLPLTHNKIQTYVRSSSARLEERVNTVLDKVFLAQTGIVIIGVVLSLAHFCKVSPRCLS